MLPPLCYSDASLVVGRHIRPPSAPTTLFLVLTFITTACGVLKVLGKRISNGPMSRSPVVLPSWLHQCSLPILLVFVSPFSPAEPPDILHLFL
jgi:hypothetical protein